MNFIWVFIGGGLGSLARYGVSLFFAARNSIPFPLATLISNITATGFLGITAYYIWAKWSDQKWIYPFIAIGFCGGFSTFSTFSSETFRLIQMGNYLMAFLNILISVISGLVILFLLQRSA